MKKTNIAFDRSFTDSNGFVRVEVILNRVGVLDYPEHNRKDYVPADELEKAAPLYIGMPLLVNHPADGELLNPSNIDEQDLVGFVVDAQYKDGVTIGIISILKEHAINAAKTTHMEVSCGYGQDLDMTSGIWVDTDGFAGMPGAKHEYDAIKRNIRPNHLSLVEKGRAGSVAKVYFDSAYSYTLKEEEQMVFDSVSFRKYIENKTKNENDMVENLKQVIFDNAIIEVAPDDASKVEKLVKTLSMNSAALDAKTEEIEALNEKLKSLDSKVGELKGKLSEKEAAFDTLTQENEDLKSKQTVSMDADVLRRSVSDLFRLWSEAKTLGSDLAFDSQLSLDEAREAHLLKVAPLKYHDKIKNDKVYARAYWDMSLDSVVDMKEEEKEEKEEAKDVFTYGGGHGIDGGNMYDNSAFKKKYGADNMMMGYDRGGKDMMMYDSKATDSASSNPNQLDPRITVNAEGSFSFTNRMK